MKQNREREQVIWHKEQEIRLDAKVDMTEFLTGEKKQVVQCNWEPWGSEQRWESGGESGGKKILIWQHQEATQELSLPANSWSC